MCSMGWLSRTPKAVLELRLNSWRAASRRRDEAGVHEDGLALRSSWLPPLPSFEQGRPRRPCHYRATHSSPHRSPADLHGQSHGGRVLRPSSPDQVAIPFGLALQARTRLAEVVIDRPCRARQGDHLKSEMAAWTPKLADTIRHPGGINTWPLCSRFTVS